MTIKELAINAMWFMLAVLFVTTTINIVVAFFKDKIRHKQVEDNIKAIQDYIKDTTSKK